ncbi:MAG: helix-turn-helix transcriptional regulator [Clostridiales bacterium]|nr:helix-turn-helix transcriptional regulator [Clostridiales bacterium]MDY4172655.1 helix-turn-helix transcriptional regulator [Evtepia sp.]
MSFLSARTKAGFSQAEVAERIGISDAAVSMWETGKTNPRASILPELARLYGCTVDELLSPENNQKALERNDVDAG